MTLDKKYVVVDAHNHYVPKEAVAKAGKTEGISYGARSLNPSIAYQKLFDIESNLCQMDDCGVDMSLLGLANWIVPGLEVCRVINDSYEKLDRDYPGRFITLAHVPYHEGISALRELDRAINELGLKGITMLTSIEGLTLDSETLYPLYEKVSRMDVPIVVHPTAKMPIWGGVKYNLSSSISREYEIAKSVVEVQQGVLTKFPDLKFVFAHYGGGIPVFKGRIISWFSLTPDDLPPGHQDIPRSLNEAREFGLMKTFNQYFNKMYFDMAGFAGFMPIAKAALMSIKHTRICFGTDYPYEFLRPDDYRGYLASIKRLDLSEGEKKALLGGNILRLFGVKTGARPC